MKKIMVVDDNPDMISTVKRGLEALSAGYTIIEAETGKDCIELLEKGERPDLILLDIMMPKMDGWDTAAHIKSNQRWKNIPLVFLTAKTDNISTGIGKITSRDYIKKPFDLFDFRKRLDTILKI